jgi:hypothetical protein
MSADETRGVTEHEHEHRPVSGLGFCQSCHKQAQVRLLVRVCRSPGCGERQLVLFCLECEGLLEKAYDLTAGEPAPVIKEFIERLQQLKNPVTPPVSDRLCACGCGQPVTSPRPEARYATPACRVRAHRDRQP